MSVILYKTFDDKRKVVKELRNPVTYSSYKFTEDTSILNPVLWVPYSSSTISNNYAYISEFGRYYFITDIITRPDFIEIHCAVDPLMSYKTQLQDLRALVARYEGTGPGLLADNLYTFREGSNVRAYRWGSGFDVQGIGKAGNANYVISLIG